METGREAALEKLSYRLTIVDARYAVFSCLHEIGHFLDHQALGEVQQFS